MAIGKDIFRSLIREGQESIKNVELYERPFEFEPNGRYVLVGTRQAGKSYMLFMRARQLMAQGHSVEEIVYIDMDDERLLGMEAADLDSILQAYASMYEYRPILFFDELQNVDGWEHFARRLANQKYMVYITGSNAKMLSRDIQTTLGGRFMEANVFPYSFAEFIEAQGLVLGKQWMYGSERAKVQKLFTDYLNWGGFPELLLFKNKRHWLNDLYEKIILGDIVVRNKVKNEMALRTVYKRLADNVMQPTSYNRLANLIKGVGISTSTSSVISYVSFAKDACFLFTLDNLASKFVEKETVKKHYFVDNGLLSIFHTNGLSPLLENVCAIHLHKKYGDGLYFYNRNIEVDFYVPDEGLAVQVSCSVADEETLKREVKALTKLHSLFGLKRMQIVTLDEEREVSVDGGLTVEIVPSWRWLLG